MRVVRINTTAFKEEDFFLMTTLSDDQIAEVIKPIIESDNESLVNELKSRYKLEFIEMYNEIETLKI